MNHRMLDGTAAGGPLNCLSSPGSLGCGHGRRAIALRQIGSALVAHGVPTLDGGETYTSARRPAGPSARPTSANAYFSGRRGGGFESSARVGARPRACIILLARVL